MTLIINNNRRLGAESGSVNGPVNPLVALINFSYVVEKRQRRNRLSFSSPAALLGHSLSLINQPHLSGESGKCYFESDLRRTGNVRIRPCWGGLY